MRDFRLGRAVVFSAIVFWAFAATAATASETSLFEAQWEAAWSQYRQASFAASPIDHAPQAAQQALQAFLADWTQLTRQWSGHPPPHYAEDPDFAEQLNAIGMLAAQATQQMEHGKLDQGYDSLLQIRALATALRHRNGLAEYRDLLTLFDEKLAEAEDDDFEAPQTSPELTFTLIEQVGVLAFLVEQLEKNAPPALIDNTDFVAALAEIDQQTRGLRAAIVAGRSAPTQAALADLRRALTLLIRTYG